MIVLERFLPCVTQDGGVVQRSSAVAIHLVDAGAVLQQELAGCQGILGKYNRTWELLTKMVHSNFYHYHQAWLSIVMKCNARVELNSLLTTETACISGVLESSDALTQLTSAP